MDRSACSENRELISAYVDGDLSGDERAGLMAHLSGCVDCRETLEVYRLIGTRIRSIPATQPPDQLIDSIFAETIDAQPRRLFIVSSRLGYSLAAVAAVLLIFVVAVYLIVGGYQRGLEPKIASTAPGDGDTWPIQKPIEITFNKPMDHVSVEEALAILPPEEDPRLSLAWDGNTLIIGQNQTLLPGTSYQILIGAGAVDTYGNELESDFRLSFGTTSTVEVVETPTLAPTAAIGETPTPFSSPDLQTPEPTSTGNIAIVTSPATTQPGQPTATSGTSMGTPVTATPGAADPTEPATPLTDDPTPTPTSDGPATATPTENPSVDETATPTPTPEPTEAPSPTTVPTATATTPPTATVPAATPTESTIPVTGGFGDVYWGDETVRARLGQPLAPASSTGALQLGFQHGTMYYRSDTGTIYVLNGNNQTWGSFLDTSTSSPEPQAGPEDGVWIPGGILGYLWNAEPSVSAELGYATQEYPASFSAQVQEFEAGVMLSSPDFIWVIYDDLTWEWFGNSGG